MSKFADALSERSNWDIVFDRLNALTAKVEKLENAPLAADRARWRDVAQSVETPFTREAAGLTAEQYATKILRIEAGGVAIEADENVCTLFLAMDKSSEVPIREAWTKALKYHLTAFAAQQLAAVKELEDLLRWICVDALNEAWMYEVRGRAKDDYISLRHIKERIVKALSPKENANAK